MFSPLLLFLSACPLLRFVAAFDNSRNDNLAIYWGQDSAGNQQRLSTYCSDSTINAIPLAFLYIFFGQGGAPVIDFANTCNQFDDKLFPGTQLANCSFMASDIKTCQSKGKIVTISLGGATGEINFSSDSQASSFADTIWNLFLGGTSKTRPFGSAVLDGVDLDLESGTGQHFVAFAKRLLTHYSGASKKYYLTGAPQCPFPDAAMGSILNAVKFDAVYVQFYNNFCGLNAPSQFNFGTWNNWALNTSPNKNVKIYIGAPGSKNAAGTGYVNATTLAKTIASTRKKFPKTFGGVMMWDASEARTNNRYDKAAKSALTSGATTSTTKKTTTTTSTTKKTTTTTKQTTTTTKETTTTTTTKKTTTTVTKTTTTKTTSKTTSSATSTGSPAAQDTMQAAFPANTQFAPQQEGMQYYGV